MGGAPFPVEEGIASAVRAKDLNIWDSSRVDRGVEDVFRAETTFVGFAVDGIRQQAV
jgi:hypothetical protein